MGQNTLDGDVTFMQCDALERNSRGALSSNAGPQKYQPDLLVDTEHAVMPHVMLRGSGVESSKAAMQIGYQQKRAARTSATSHPGPPEPLARCGVRSGLLR